MNEYASVNQANHRLVMIMEKLNKYGRIDVQEIAQELDVSTATIRRDFNELERQGHLRRVHGGAVLSNVSTTFEYLYHAKVALRMDEKSGLPYRQPMRSRMAMQYFLIQGLLPAR